MFNEDLKKRLLSFLWRTSVMILLLVIAEFTKILPTLGLSEIATVVIGLILNEVSKFINSKYSVGKAVLGAIKGVK